MNQNMPEMASSAYTSMAYATDDFEAAVANHMAAIPRRIALGGMAQLQQHHTQVIPMNARRIVKVFVADPNENIPMDECLLYKGAEKLTDATDQELFFELDIKSMLEVHNEKRVKLIDKKVKDRTEFLEPAKVRDLKMIVVTVATL